MRHSFASIGNDPGFAEVTIVALLGHAKGAITSKDIHVLDATLATAAALVNVPHFVSVFKYHIDSMLFSGKFQAQKTLQQSPSNHRLGSPYHFIAASQRVPGEVSLVAD